jgi:hypothetical protein
MAMGDRTPHPSPNSFRHRPPGRLYLGLYLGLTAVLSLGLSSCMPAPLELLWRNAAVNKAKLQLQVTPAATPGTYTVVGQTDLPDKTSLRIAAVRYLYPTNPASQKLNAKPTYAILAYQTARVQQGQWQANLTLWQAATDGRYQESWQFDPPALGQTAVALEVKPAPEVTFVVSPAPGDKADPIQQLEQQLKTQGKVLASELVRRNEDGDRYVQASQTLAISLPTGSTTPPAPRPDDINGGWGRRYLFPPEPQNPYLLEFPKHRRTDAPAKPQEFMQ